MVAEKPAEANRFKQFSLKFTDGEGEFYCGLAKEVSSYALGAHLVPTTEYALRFAFEPAEDLETKERGTRFVGQRFLNTEYPREK